jgi:hypothetical protein
VDADNKSELVLRVCVINGREEEIDPQAVYTIVSIDYFGNGRAPRPKQRAAIPYLGNAQKIQPLGLTMRDAMIQYVKDETTAGRSIRTNLDGRFKPEATGEVRP